MLFRSTKEIKGIGIRVGRIQGPRKGILRGVQREEMRQGLDEDKVRTRSRRGRGRGEVEVEAEARTRWWGD